MVDFRNISVIDKRKLYFLIYFLNTDKYYTLTNIFSVQKLFKGDNSDNVDVLPNESYGNSKEMIRVCL